MPLLTCAAIACLLLALGLWFRARQRRRQRWEDLGPSEAGQAAATGSDPPATDETPPIARKTAQAMDLAMLLARAERWIEDKESQGEARWLSVRGWAEPNDIQRLFFIVRELAPRAFGADRLVLGGEDPVELALLVGSRRWTFQPRRREDWLDEAFWTFLNRVLEARGRPERLATPRLANWRFPLAVTSVEELAQLRGEGLGFLGSGIPLYPRKRQSGVTLLRRPPADPQALLNDVSQILGEDEPGQILARVGSGLGAHLRKYGLLQLAGFGDFRIQPGLGLGSGSGQVTPLPADHTHSIRFRPARELKQALTAPIPGLQPAPVARLGGLDRAELVAVLRAIRRSLGMGCGAAHIPGLGRFWRQQRPTSILRHAQNLQPLLVPARWDVAFEPDPSLLGSAD